MIRLSIVLVLMMLVPRLLLAQEVTDKPPQPTLDVNSDDRSIDIRWEPIQGAVAYELYVWTSEDGWQRLGSDLPANEFTHTNLNAGTKYWYTYRGISPSGNSAWSEYGSDEISPTASLATPALKVRVASNAILVSWDAVNGASHYELWVWDSGSGWSRLRNDLQQPMFSHTVVSGITYWYAVRARSQGRSSDWSEYVSGRLPDNVAFEGTSALTPSATLTPEVSAATSTPSATPTPAVTPAPTAAPQPIVLSGITIAPENRCSRYSASDYSYPQSLEAEIVAGMGGRIYGPYTGTYFEDTGQTDIEHIVARSEAHDSGLCATNRSERRAFARDLLNLTLASPGVNRHQKSAKDVAEWLPSENSCWYVNRVVEVKRKYSLTMDQAEYAKAQKVLAGCASTDMVFAARSVTATPTATPTPTPTPTPTATPTPTPTETASDESGKSVGAIVAFHGFNRFSVTLYWGLPTEEPVNYQVNWAEGQAYLFGIPLRFAAV